MIHLLYQGYSTGHLASFSMLFSMLLVAIVIALAFHEFGHAWTARCFGDDTAERAGRLTLNPMAHIDPVGLLMVVLAGIGYAKPVPTDPRKFTSRYADLLVAAAGPGMNLLLAVVTVTCYFVMTEWLGVDERGLVSAFCFTFTQLNLALMLFNLLPIGALDGHYILPYFLPRRLALWYRYYNQRYGNLLLLALICLALFGERIDLDINLLSVLWKAIDEILSLIQVFD